MITGKDAKGKGIVAEVTHPKFDDFKTPRMGGVLKKGTLIDFAVKGIYRFQMLHFPAYDHQGIYENKTLCVDEKSCQIIFYFMRFIQESKIANNKM